jgi:dienelactone hydrolase
MAVREEAFTLDSPRSGRIDGDIRFPEEADGPLPVVVMCHGFKGFKDWGPFPAWGRFLAEGGLASVLFNFSFDGVSADAPIEFTELEKFAENTYTRELDDLAAVIGAAESGRLPGPALAADEAARDTAGDNGAQLGLMGHSRGGGTAILHAARSERVRALTTWSAVGGFIERFTPEQVADWEERGYTEVTNSRTGQTMRLNRVLYDDAMAHREHLDILDAARRVEMPWLLVHAADDEAVPFDEAQELNDAAPGAELEEAEGGHTFGGAHPFEGEGIDDVPPSLRRVWKRTRRFFLDHLREASP